MFERAVTFREAGDRVGHGRIDLYKRGSFVLEAKQSRNRPDRPDKAVPGQNDLFDPSAAPESRGRRGADHGQRHGRGGAGAGRLRPGDARALSDRSIPR